MTTKQIIERVCKEYDVTEEELFSKGRRARFVRPRHAIAYLLREHRAMSLNQIAGVLGFKDHTSVSHAISQVRTGIRQRTKETETLRSLEREMFPVGEEFPRGQNPKFIGGVLTRFLEQKLKIHSNRIPLATDRYGRTYLMLKAEPRLLSSERAIGTIVDAANYFNGSILKVK